MPPNVIEFIVPCEPAATVSGMALANAPNTTSATRWEVSRLPPTTAAGGSGSSRLPVGVSIVMGR